MTIDILSLFVILPLLVIDGVFLAEVSLGLIRPRRPLPVFGPRPSIAILMPAHNEAAAIAESRDEIKQHITGGARVVVVADNCTDETVRYANAAGCETVVRNDPQQNGKGYALAAGLDYLRRNPPEIVVVIDADCSIDDGSLELLAKRAFSSGCVVQAAYLLRPDQKAPPTIQISNFAFAVKNLVRQRGSQRLGAAAILVGSGMAFPWQIISSLDLATGNIVEDLALGIELVCRQNAPIFEDAAMVWSDASSANGTTIQRARWEGGFMSTAMKSAWPLIREGVLHRDFKQFWLGAHLLVPALAMVVTLNVGVLLLCTAAAAITAEWLPVRCAAILLMLVFGAVLFAWFNVGYQFMRARVFFYIPLYIFRKICVYKRLLTGRITMEWVRTERKFEDPV